ncbi:hypothetical protein BASA81_001798 [Batrachochytrium salamandrivorans]|nr:hypothetical protein BASA81_001798 [Batrachochytrium salamandrivorans]
MEDEAWSQSMVGKEIDIEFGSEFFPARVQSYRNGVFAAIYFSDGSLERMLLHADQTGSDPKLEDKFVWRYAVDQTCSTTASQAAFTTNKRSKLQDETEWRQKLVGTDVELLLSLESGDKEWVDCHVDKVDENGVFTLFLVDYERRDRFMLTPDFTFIKGSTDEEQVVGIWRTRPKRKISPEDKLWRESMVNRVISIPFEGEWLLANVEEDVLNNDLFLIRYLPTSNSLEQQDDSFEQVMLFPNMKGSDPSGDDEFEWKLMENHVASTNRGVLDDSTFSGFLLLQRLVWIEYEKECPMSV